MFSELQAFVCDRCRKLITQSMSLRSNALLADLLFYGFCFPDLSAQQFNTSLFRRPKLSLTISRPAIRSAARNCVFECSSLAIRSASVMNTKC
jgi:hypothetical protein